MLPLVCNDAVALLFIFDLTRKSTLNSVKEWYRQARGFNKSAIPFLVGTKYDLYEQFPLEEQHEIAHQVRTLLSPPALVPDSPTTTPSSVQEVRKGDEGALDLLLDVAFHQVSPLSPISVVFSRAESPRGRPPPPLQRPEDLQDCARQGAPCDLRSQLAAGITDTGV